MTLTQLHKRPDGRNLLSVELRSEQLSAKVLNIGAALQDLRLKGHAAPLVLGYQDPLDYLHNPNYLGAIVGRVANRISGGAFTLDGTRFELDKNENGTTTLHGGHDGCSHRVWDVLDHGPDYVSLSQSLPDGHMGFPGQLDLTVTYQLRDAELAVTIHAQTNAKTVCNPAPHFYFNLDGRADLSNHLLQLHSNQIIPTCNGIPISGPVNAETLGFALTTAREIPEGLDHHICFAETTGSLKEMASLSSPAVTLNLSSTAPGVQIYDGLGLRIQGRGLEGRNYTARAGVAIEPHCWVDAPNQPWLHQCLLEPSQTFCTHSVFSFHPTT